MISSKDVFQSFHAALLGRRVLLMDYKMIEIDTWIVDKNSLFVTQNKHYGLFINQLRSVKSFFQKINNEMKINKKKLLKTNPIIHLEQQHFRFA